MLHHIHSEPEGDADVMGDKDGDGDADGDSDSEVEGDGVADADAESERAHGPSINRHSMGSRHGGQSQSPKLQTHMPAALEAGAYQRETQMRMGMALMGENRANLQHLARFLFLCGMFW